jgi:excisionase family DNA binding protein
VHPAAQSHARSLSKARAGPHRLECVSRTRRGVTSSHWDIPVISELLPSTNGHTARTRYEAATDAGRDDCAKQVGRRREATPTYVIQTGPELESPIDVKTAARFLGVSPSLVYCYVERKQIPHYRMMGRAVRFRLSELVTWRQQFHVNGGIDD